MEQQIMKNWRVAVKIITDSNQYGNNQCRKDFTKIELAMVVSVRSLLDGKHLPTRYTVATRPGVDLSHGYNGGPPPLAQSSHTRYRRPEIMKHTKAP
jgi:hypothetical protein